MTSFSLRITLVLVAKRIVMNAFHLLKNKRSNSLHRFIDVPFSPQLTRAKTSMRLRFYL